jgi:hypothetical protein
MPDEYSENDLFLLAALLRESLQQSSAISSVDRDLIAAAVEIIRKLEANLKNIATKTYVDFRVGALEDMLGPLIAQMASVTTKLSKVMLPDTPKFYLEQNEIDFIQKSMPEIAKMKVELEQLKNDLVTAAIQQKILP